MPTVASVLAEFNVRAPGDKAANWDPHGLQVGDPGLEVGRLAVCHEVTESVAARAIDEAVDLLVTYHPLLFRPTARLVAGPGPNGRAFRLARAGVGVATVHTAWDAAVGGTCDALAAAIGLVQLRSFGPIDPSAATKLVTFVPAGAADLVARALADAGAGRIGNYTACSFRSEGTGTFVPGPGAQPVGGRIDGSNQEQEVRLEVLVSKELEATAVAALVGSHPYEEPAFDLYEVRANPGLIGRVGNLERATPLGDFADKVRDALGGSGRYAGEQARDVLTVAVVPGSGGSFLGAASASGADVFVSGDLSHHDTRASLDAGMSTIDPGHAATERPGVLRLVTLARTIIPDVIDLTGDAIPWKEN